MGEEAGELDSFVRFLVMRLLNSLKGKALNYVRDGRDDSQVRRDFFVSFPCVHTFPAASHREIAHIFWSTLQLLLGKKQSFFDQQLFLPFRGIRKRVCFV